MHVSVALHANCFDASALVKLYVEEDKSDIVRAYFRRQATLYTTPFCFYEALGILKRNWLKKLLTKDQYLKSVFNLSAWYGAVLRMGLADLDYSESHVLFPAMNLAEKHSLDISDAFQILSVKAGVYSPLAGGSQTVLVTADRGLASAARSEGLRVWSVMDEDPPP
jgi:predicted nucleic acid-binding protein